MRDQIGGVLFQCGEAFQGAIDLAFLLRQRRPLRDDIGLLGGHLGVWSGAEHAQLHRQLRLLRQQRC